MQVVSGFMVSIILICAIITAKLLDILYVVLSAATAPLRLQLLSKLAFLVIMMLMDFVIHFHLKQCLEEGRT